MIIFKTLDEIHQYTKQQSKAEQTKVQTGGLSSASFYAYGTTWLGTDYDQTLSIVPILMPNIAETSSAV